MGSAMEQCDRQTDQGEHCRRPESEHPAEQIDPEPTHILPEPTHVLTQVRPQLGQALLKPGDEASEVQLVELAEIRAVGQVHGVEPVH